MGTSKVSAGSSGGINYPSMAVAFARGYETMSNDNGHRIFAVGHPEKVVDFGYRAQHVTTVVANDIVQGFYGSGPRRSYSVGCSQSGIHALMEAQRFPGDYDGLIGDDPSYFWTYLMVAEVWDSLAATLEGVKKIYQGPVNSRTGKQIFPDLPRGSELGWLGLWVGLTVPGGSSCEFYRYGCIRVAAARTTPPTS